jgi:hypothetical protein
VREMADQAERAYLFSAPGPIASWIDQQWIEAMRSLLPGPAFERLILNRWTSQSGDFVTTEQWARCVDESLAPATGATRGTSHIAAIDLGLTRDRTAICVVHHDNTNVVLDEMMVLEGSRDEPVSIANVERILLDVARRYPGVKVLADPWQFQSSLQRLRGEMRIHEFTFSASSVQRLSSALYETISSATLRVFPDPELEREILGLRVVQTASGWKFDHRSGGYSDRAVTLAMCVQEAVKSPGVGRPPVLGGAPPHHLIANLHRGDELQHEGRLTTAKYGEAF